MLSSVVGGCNSEENKKRSSFVCHSSSNNNTTWEKLGFHLKPAMADLCGYSEAAATSCEHNIIILSA